MKLQNIIKEANISQKENEGAFFASVALTVLEQFENFSLLDSAESIKKNLQVLLGIETFAENIFLTNAIYLHYNIKDILLQVSCRCDKIALW